MLVVILTCHGFVTAVTHFLGIRGESLASTIAVFLPWVVVILVTKPALLADPVSSALCDTSLIPDGPF